MNRIYLDNASTTFPKPEECVQAITRYLTESGCNINRGGYQSAYDAAAVVFETRMQLGELFNGGDPRNVVFTKNVTESLNVVLKGYLKPGDHVLVSSMEHNAVMRPLRQLEKQGVSFTRIPCRQDGSMDLALLPGLLRDNTRAVVMTGASNVCGTVLPLEEVGKFAHSHGLRFFADTAQVAGVLPVDMETMHIDALCFTGHKGLLGPQGIGGFILKPELVGEIEPLLSGGTGSISHTEEIPSFMPDRFEPGTMNLPGIFGLHGALGFLKETEIDTVCNHELQLTAQFLQGLLPMEEAGLLRIVGKKDLTDRVGVVSIHACGMDNAELAFRLDDEYGIQTRVGLHCAPSAHQTLGTYPAGTVRFSFGYRNTPEEIETALQALQSILGGITNGL